jgi:hypothetical protein
VSKLGKTHHKTWTHRPFTHPHPQHSTDLQQHLYPRALPGAVVAERAEGVPHSAGHDCVDEALPGGGEAGNSVGVLVEWGGRGARGIQQQRPPPPWMPPLFHHPHQTKRLLLALPCLSSQSPSHLTLMGTPTDAMCSASASRRERDGCPRRWSSPFWLVCWFGGLRVGCVCMFVYG